ncbi:hypothetical protein [Hanstruepera ponticola]|uniref:hypothetical protein n=1 Tax=Hanstruepera ponticola TaxID=2042995 RepID=UPI00177FB9AB|nr:hypothetical protein [Hanstruepera ponticola]
MKNFSLYFFIAFALLNCSSSKIDKKLLGNWYYVSGNQIISVFQFHKDSLVINERIGKTTLKWFSKNQRINSAYLKENGPQYDYYLNPNNDTLFLRLLGKVNLEDITLIRAKNNYDLFKKIIGLNIELPESDINLNPISISDHNFNVYAGYKDNNLIVKTDSNPNLDKIIEEVGRFRKNSRDEAKRFLKFNLIADKNIPASQMDSIISILEETSISKVYRTYQNKNTTNKGGLYWFCKQIK